MKKMIWKPLLLSVFMGVLARAITLFAAMAWTRRYWSPGGRIYYTALAFLALLLTWSLIYWDVLL